VPLSDMAQTRRCVVPQSAAIHVAAAALIL
jgi:hypothetical protein